MSNTTGSDDSGQDLQSMGLAVTLGFGTAVSLAVLVGGGVWLDTKMDSAPLWSLIGLVLGLVAAGYQLYELVLASSKDREHGPLGRKLSSRKNQASR